MRVSALHERQRGHLLLWPRSSLFRRKARSVPTLQVSKPRLQVDRGVPGIRKPVSLTCYSPAAHSPNPWGAWWWSWWRSQGQPWKRRAVGPFWGKMDKRGHLSFGSFQSESAWRTKPVDILKPVWNSSILAACAHSARLTFHCGGRPVSSGSWSSGEGVGREQAFRAWRTDCSPRMPAIRPLSGALVFSV